MKIPTNSKKYKNRRYKLLSIKERMKNLREHKKSCKIQKKEETMNFFLKYQMKVKRNLLRFMIISFWMENYILSDKKYSDNNSKFLKCPHVFISSSQIYKLLFGSFCLKDLHGFYFTGNNRVFGRIAENQVFKKYPKIKRAFCLFSSVFPFLCGAPDGFIG